MIERAVSSRARSAFTIVELLVVVAIIAMVAAMIVTLPQEEQRDVAVSGAAEELAATLRLARSMAIDRAAVVGVAFNISNSAGSNGRVLNNHDGGHWYQIIGPWEDYTGGGGNSNEAMSGPPPRRDLKNNTETVLSAALSQIQTCWIGDRHILAPKQVRFIALCDQDNGQAIDVESPWRWFPETYPRPWFGYYDESVQRLYPWGGYDPDIVDQAGRPSSAFYFQGDNDPIIGSRNPEERLTTASAGAGEIIFTEGSTRPVVNGEWLDYYLAFMPDGTVQECWFRGPFFMRRASYDEAPGGGGAARPGDIGDMTSLPGGSGDWKHPLTSYVGHTGGFHITLGPDVDDPNNDTFLTAEDAFRSLMPAYRVYVSNQGGISVVRVDGSRPDEVAFDTTITDWRDASKINVHYRRQALSEFRSSRPRGMPASDWLTPELLSARNWWIEVP